MRSIIAELGFVTSVEGEVFRGEAEMVPELCVPGTSALRASVVATWADILTGCLAALPMAPRVPLTLDLDVHLHRQATSGRDIVGVSTIVKAGRRIVVCDARFFEQGDDVPFAVGSGSFMASPGEEDVFPDGFVPGLVERRRLTEPLAERTDRRVLAPGEVEMPRREDGLNATGAIQGGLVAFAAEEAVLSAAGPGAVLSSLGVRYLRPFAVGPAHAVAEVLGDVATVRLTDAGQGKLGAVATARITPA